MPTPAQFKKGELVIYIDGDLNEHVARIVEVTQHEPAQYHVLVNDDDGTWHQETCGEGIDEPGAVRAF